MRGRKLGIILLVVIMVLNTAVYANIPDQSVCIDTDSSQEDSNAQEMGDIKEEYPKSTPSEATKPSEPSEEKDLISPSTATPSQATPSTATPSIATPSEATPSQAIPVEVIRFESIEPEEVPSWYIKVKKGLFGGRKHYQFTDRYGEVRHRIFGYYEDESEATWYECEPDGSVTNESFWIDLEWEDLNLAPLRWEAAEPVAEDIRDLSERIFGDGEIIGDIDLVKSDHGAGKNYDGTMYDVWNLDGEEISELFFYGHAANGMSVEDTWFHCTEDGQILDEVSALMLSVMASDARATDATATEFNFGSMTLLGVSSRPSGTLYIPCGLGAKYNWNITVGTKYVSSSGGNRISYLQCFKKDGNGSWYLAGSASGHTGYFSVTVPYGANSKYYYTASSRYMTPQEVNQGWYEGSSSDGTYIVYIDPDGESFRMAASHQFGNWQTIKAATCTSKGTRQRTCPGCGASETADIDALGHNWEANYYTGANNGTYYKRCTRCSDKTDVKNNPYTITYHANGGDGTMATQNCTYNVNLNLLSNAFQKEYYSFRNWSTEPDGNGKTFSDKQSISNLTVIYGGNVDLYAQWQPKSYNITFDDGLDGTQNITKACVYTSSLGELPVFRRPGYTLLGFFTEPEGGKRITAQSEVPHTNATYYAHWEANSYNLIFHTEESYCGSEKKRVTYDAPIGILPVASMEDFKFLGWYTQPYGQTYLEGIMHGDAIPSDNQQLKSDDVYVTAGETEIYAYLVLQYEELEHGLNRRPGADGYMGTNDDNYYVNGGDGIAGTHDDEKLYPGEDGKYGTDDDYYLDDEDRKIYPGNDGIFRTEDDYRDNGDGTNTRPGADCSFRTEDDIEVSNGLDGIPGTLDDWMNNDSSYPETNLRPGPDGTFGSEDDEVYWNGPDGIPGTEDDQLIHPGLDGELGTGDDWVENGQNYPETNLRPGPDGIFGSEDDEVYWNGPDGIPGTEDDQIIHPGLDEELGTGDDWVENGQDYPETNLRPGPDGIFGTEDDEVYWNGPDGIPGTEDDKKILPGPDGQYGSSDDCYDNDDKQEGTNIRPGADGIFGTEDDELWLNGPDGIPGTEDDVKYVQRHSSGGGAGHNRLVGKGAYKSVMEMVDTALEAMEPQQIGLISHFYDRYKSISKERNTGKYIVSTDIEFHIETATDSQITEKRENQKNSQSDAVCSDKDEPRENIKFFILGLLLVLGYGIYRFRKRKIEP